MAKYFFSPSTLAVFIRCPRCFWLHKNVKVERPRGIFPSLPGGMDRILKIYFDGFRKEGKVPPELLTLKGKLYPDLAKLEKMQNWRTGLKATVGEADALLAGALDDLWVESDGKYSPFDFKTKGSEPKTDGSEYYQHQLDCYALMLEANKMEASGKAYLMYFYPGAVHKDNILGIKKILFGYVLFPLEASPKRAKKLVISAASCLNGKMPGPAPDCEYCKYIEKREAIKCPSMI